MYYYVHPDHLGSLAIITDANGGIKQKCTYDAWGKRTLVQGSLIFDRGYTGHEHLEEFALVNMNGRMYDPMLGRFLSPDPYVQNPLYSQSFNRYAYGFNNPLVFTDPDGEWAWLVIAGYFAITRAMKAGVDYSNNGRNFWEGFGKSFAVSVATIAVSYFAPFGTEVIGSMVWGTIGGAATGALNAWATGGDYKQNMLVGAGMGAAFGFLSSQQTQNMINGKGFKNNDAVLKDFASGKYTAAGGKWQQDALDYFGFEGKYDPQIENPGQFDPKTGLIKYNDVAFSKNYDYLQAVHKEEFFHSKDYLYAKANTPKNYSYHEYEEWRAQNHLYKNQGLYPKSGLNWVDRIKYWGVQAGVYETVITPSGAYYSSTFTTKWWHWIYKIQRRW